MVLIEVQIENYKRSKKRIEEESKRKMEEHQRKLLAETERKLMDTKSRAQRDLMTKEEKLARIRGILDTQTTPGTVSKNLKMKTYGSSSTVRNVSSVVLPIVSWLYNYKYIASYNFIRRERRVEDLFLNQQKKKLQNARIDLPLDQSEVEIHLQNRHHGHMVVQQHPEQVVDALFQPRISFINHVRGLMERDGLLIHQII